VLEFEHPVLPVSGQSGQLLEITAIATRKIRILSTQGCHITWEESKSCHLCLMLMRGRICLMQSIHRLQTVLNALTTQRLWFSYSLRWHFSLA